MALVAELWASGTTPVIGDTRRMLQIKEILATKGIILNVSGVTAVYGPTSGLFVGGVPTVVPVGDGAIAIRNDGQQFQYFNGAWS